jgi:uncharacterized protein (DUF697 family)
MRIAQAFTPGSAAHHTVTLALQGVTKGCNAVNGVVGFVRVVLPMRERIGY